MKTQPHSGLCPGYNPANKSKKLRQRRENLQTIFEIAPVGMMLVDDD
jgi:hypothetical protein